MAIFKVAGTEAAVCVIQGFQHMRLLSEPILNDYDCPLLTLSNSIFTTSTENIKRLGMFPLCTNVQVVVN